MYALDVYKKTNVTFALLVGLLALLVVLPSPVAAQANEVPVCTANACASFIDRYINPFVVLLTWCVGIFAAISITVAGIQYAASADDPGKVTQAKTRIFNTIIGLIAYVFLFAFLNYIVPGGLL